MALAYYFAAVLADGDYLNDWMTHLPFVVRPVVEALGMLLAWVTGA